MKLRLFVYGSCGSGKTSFLRQLIQGNGLRITSNQKLVKFMSSSISPTGQVIPTTTGFDRLEIKLGSDSYVISDRQGELLSESVNELSSDKSWLSLNKNWVANQIISCDAILFFFDPTAQSTVDLIRQTDQIQKHHNEELLRAKQIIDFVLRVRQNKFTPVLFIVTHCDLIDLIPQLSGRTENWIVAVNEYLRESYNAFLEGFYPKSLICREQLFFHVTTIQESKQPRKTSIIQPGTAPPAKVDTINWVDSFPFAVDLANIFRQVSKHINLIEIFRRNDRRSYRSVIFAFVFCLCLVFFVPLIINKMSVQPFVGELQKNTISIIDRVPQLKAFFDNDTDSNFDATLNFSALDNSNELNNKNAAVLNESLYTLMRQLNKLEDMKQQDTENYKNLSAKWTETLQKIEQTFDTCKFENNRVKAELFEIILSRLTDSSVRVTPQLDNVLRKFWNFYREMLITELADEIQVNQSAGSTGKQQLEMLCSKMERFFIETNNSNVRGDSFSSKPNETTKGLKDSNQKEQIKQDIRKSFKACENFLVSYPIEIRLREISYSSDIGIDRDFLRRLKISGLDSNPIYIDLIISSGYRNDKVCQFLPNKDRVTVLLNLESNLQISLEQMYKGNVISNKNNTADNNTNNTNNTNDKNTAEQNVEDSKKQNQEITAGWQELMMWNVDPHKNNKSLEGVGIKFYLQFENENNTQYTCEGEGMKIQLEIKRARIVPNFLWEVINRTAN
ncbi:MAG: GTPase domain-containing protein [Planctomycetaceae bacterium]|jgi:hypothetical protein|nr:GTPase domain-containing protein [Planctomycetaceae bacterium]